MIESDHMYGLDEHLPRARQRPRCGARLRGERAGLRCQRRVVQHRTTCPSHLGRCRLGMSKGPTTAEGRRRVSEAQKRRWARWREDRAASIPATGKPIGRPRKPKELTLKEWYAEKHQRVRDWNDPSKWGTLGR
jgi:hypothetical protein